MGQDIVGVFTSAPDVICGALEDLSVGHCVHHCSLRENGRRRTELRKQWQMPQQDGLQWEGAARMEERLDLARPENTLRKLLTAFVFYKAFGQIGDDQHCGEKLRSKVK
jgi:hypothetical protein